MSADYKIATGPFLFCLDKAGVLNDFPRSAFILDRTASVWRNEAFSFLFCSVFILLFSTTQTKSCVSASAQKKLKKVIVTAEKTIKTTKVSLITVCKGESGYKIDCFANISTEERKRHYLETRSRSNVSGAYAYWKKQMWSNSWAHCNNY